MKKAIVSLTFFIVVIAGPVALANVQRGNPIADRHEPGQSSSLDKFPLLAMEDECLDRSGYGNMLRGLGKNPVTPGVTDKTARREQERKEREALKAMLENLCDEELDQRIQRARRILEDMQRDFASSRKELEGWLCESQDAEEKAMIASFKMLATAALEMRPIKKRDAKRFKRLKELAEKGMEALNYDGSTFVKVNLYDTKEDFIQARSNLEIAQKILSELNPQFSEFAADCAEYITEAGRWTLSAQQIAAINKNLDSPKGMLAAQKKMKELMEKLVREKNRRAKEGGAP